MSCAEKVGNIEEDGERQRCHREAGRLRETETQKEVGTEASESERETKTQKNQKQRQSQRERERGTERENALIQGEMQRQPEAEREERRRGPRDTPLLPQPCAVNPLPPRLSSTGLGSLQPQEGRDQLATVLWPGCPATGQQLAPTDQECTYLDFYRVVLVEVDWCDPRNVEGPGITREREKQQGPRQPILLGRREVAVGMGERGEQLSGAPSHLL